LSSSQGPTTYSYDANGSTLSEGGYAYSYDLRNRLTSSAGVGQTEQYFFNGLGQRIEKAGSAGTTIFSYDGSGQLVGEYDSHGHAIEETIYLGNSPVAVVERAGTFYVHSDYRNTPRQIDDAWARPVWTWDPTSFGGDLPNENPRSKAGGQFVYNLRFPGQYHDAETGLFYNYFRDYNPRIARYVESDPIGLLGGPNTYTYVRADSVNLSDPFGLCDQQPNCDTVLPNGQTIRQVVQTAIFNIEEAAGPYDFFGAGEFGAFIATVEPRGPIDFKNNLGPDPTGFLGAAGNFAYGAISSGIGYSQGFAEFGAGLYAIHAGKPNPSNPFYEDNSAAQNLPAGYATIGCTQ
jgi:RHS repeat-associated protein